MNRRGVSIIEVVIAAAIGAASIGILMAHSKQDYNATLAMTRKVAAQNYASDLVEIFQAMPPDQLKNYLNRDPVTGAVGSNLYRFCSPANFDALAPSGPAIAYPNPIANLPQDSSLGTPIANRSFTLRVVDIKTLVPNAAACGKHINDIALGADEVFLMNVKVAWGENRGKEVEVNAILPRPAVPSNSGGTPIIPVVPPVNPCLNNNALGLLTFETWPNGGVTNNGDKVTNQYTKSHGITFCFDEKKNGTCNGKSVPEIAKVGSPKTAFSCKTAGCSSEEDGIRNDPGPPVKDYRTLVGKSFLRADNYPVLVDYVAPVQEASGYVIDVADAMIVETVKIVPLDAVGKPIPGAAVTVREGDPNTGDGFATYWSINRPSADIHAIRFEFNDSGFALDSFSPVKVCPHI